MALEEINSIADLKSYIAERTRETWEDRGIPYYLSYVASDLKNRNVNYRDFIGASKLSQWAATNDFVDVKYVAHPTVKAKVGFVPSDAEFSFEVDPKAAGDGPTSASLKRRGKALFQFVEALSNLPDDVLVDLKIPASVLTALLRQ
ncbi:hypothetical protein [Kaistia nematophila]|uniref:Uncharacterized protein n=1 Tax=Kaistia nematophila TaxID=2994654 RepID=A0A9X3ILF3_9HYPH|nr:hypothetical protein [Kaistia nematophila]MCX5570468.1 hypothetical protein [Kaistia nematophila]